MDNYCAATHRNHSLDLATWLRKHPWGLSHILISDKHKLLFCSVPKVSSTNWKNVFLILNGNVSLQNVRDGDGLSLDRTHGNTVTLDQYNLTLDELRLRLETYTSFLFVRNPFTRALSAYRDKFQSEKSTDFNYIRTVYGPKMNGYGNRSLTEDDPEYTSATFSEFARYVGDPRTRFGIAEDHWTPMADLCFPCQHKYDVIGNLETYSRDTRMILTGKIGRPELYGVAMRKPPQTTNSSESAQMRRYFSSLSEGEIQGLKRRYVDDLNLFGYGVPTFLLSSR